jgi:hypothetical protein
MYLDNTNTSRSGFRYTYTGQQILPYAQDLLIKKCEEERQARQEVIRMTRDPTINTQDRRVEEAKRAVTTSATLVEELSVYVHEFSRNPSREYNLSLGDVVFFGLVTKEIRAEIELAIKPSY